MNALDSRSLRAGDCFGQKFPMADEVRYFISAGGELVPAADQRGEGGFVIRVKAATGGGSQQHNVKVSRNGNKLTPEPAELEISVGDGVLWYTTDPGVAGFHVAGKGASFGFNSARIETDAVYTHVFGVAGKYDWRDPNGSGLHGSIEVVDPKVTCTEDRSRWYESLKKPASFVVEGGKSSPEAVKIVVGQTVFWSIVNSKGVAITDTRMVSKSCQ